MDEVFICARCSKEVEPGVGDLYEVRILALADPHAPKIEEELSAEEIREQINLTLAQLENVSPTEARDQVYRSLVIHFCRDCYDIWIEAPAG